MSPLWLLLGCATPPEPPPPPSFLVVTLDTTRADALGAYGADPSPSPNIDRLAAKGLLVREAQTTVPLTLPAHSSLFTGKWPDEHGVRDNLGFVLDAGHDTLAERFDDAGYDTAAFVSAIVLDASFGLDQGFDHYDDGFDLTTAGSSGLAVTQHPSAEVVDRALAWLTDRNNPFFLWVHLYDPHRPLQAPEPFASAFPPYEAEIAAADHQIGRLVDRLADRKDVVTVVLSDHGEGNGEHGELTHGQLAYRSTLRIPIVLAGPGISPGELAGPASIVDVAGTLAELAGLPVIGGGSTLDRPASVLYGETLYPRLNLGLHDLAVAQDDTWRLVDGARAELFHWTTDPGELHDVAADHPEEVARLRAVLSQHDRSATASAMPPETSAALAALGYLAGLPAIGDALRDPRDAPDMATAFERVILDARTRPPTEGAAVLEAFLQEYPAVSGARQLLVTAWEAAGQTEKARDALRPLRQARPNDPVLAARDAELQLAGGDLPGATAALVAVRDTDPDVVPVRALLAELYRRQGRCDLATIEVDAGLALSPESSRLLLVRGACRHHAGRLAEAEADLRAALALDPDNRDAHGVLGHVLAEASRFDEAARAFQAQIARTPDRRELDALLGAALYGGGDWMAAVAPLERAASEPSDAESRILLADTLLRTGGDVARGQSLLMEAEALTPEDPRISRVRAALLMAEGDVDSAIRALGGH